MKITDILVRLYERVTGTPATPRTSAVVARFGPYLAGMAVAKAASVLGQLLVSRWLGPAEFGRVAIVLATAGIVALPAAAGWGSAFVRYGAGRPETEWGPLLRWAGFRSLAFTSALAAGIVILGGLVAPAWGIPVRVLAAGAALGLLMATWLLAKSACQCREDWRRFVACELSWSVILVVGASVLAATGAFDWATATMLFAAAYVGGSLASHRHIATATRGGTAAPASDAARFAWLSLLVGANMTLFVYADRFVVQAVLGFDEVGIYQVYNFATVGLAATASSLVNTFAYPLFPQGDLRSFASLYRSAFVRCLPLSVPALFLAGALQVELSGFPFRPLLLLAATASAVLYSLSSFLSWLTISQGLLGTRVALGVSALSLVLLLAGAVPAARLGGLPGIFGLYAVIFFAAYCCYGSAIERFPVAASKVLAPQANDAPAGPA